MRRGVAVTARAPSHSVVAVVVTLPRGRLAALVCQVRPFGLDEAGRPILVSRRTFERRAEVAMDSVSPRG